ATLRQYQIYNKEWESIIRKVNQKESGLSELFNNAKDEKNLVENWFLRPVEDKLNQDKNKMEEFRNLTRKFIEQYKSNQSKILRKAVIEQYFEDTKPLKTDIDLYTQQQENAAAYKTEIILYAAVLREVIGKLETEIAEKRQQEQEADRQLRQITYEQISCAVYEYEDEKKEAVLERIEQETQITRLSEVRENLLKQLNAYDCSRIYAEIKELEQEKAETDEKIDVLLKDSKDHNAEIEAIGHRLYLFYTGEMQKNMQAAEEHRQQYNEAQQQRNEQTLQLNESETAIRNLAQNIGAFENAVKVYDETEDTFVKEYHAVLKRNLVGLYEDGTLAVLAKSFEEEVQNEKGKLAKITKKREELELTDRRLAQESDENTEKLTENKNQIAVLAERIAGLKHQENERIRIMKYIGLPEKQVDEREHILDSLNGKIKELDIQRSALIAQKTADEKHLQQLREGKTVELPEHIRTYFEQNGIELVYGMEWLSKNGRPEKQNKELVAKNPFLP
ncbi:MAG: hypothetical protein E7E18_08450, partial [Eubacterium sp.]|nr:hypothetical protein [Eubacterium sp.]